MIEDLDGSWLSSKGRIDFCHLYGTGQLLRVLWRGDGHAICCDASHLPDAAIGIEFQTTQRELDRRITRRRILDQDERPRIVRAATTQYGCWSIVIPPENESRNFERS